MSDLQVTPLYRQIRDALVRQIAAGQLLEGERLPPEREMAATHGVAVGTLRRALGDLQAQGLVERRQGSGNYVRGVRDAGGLYSFFRLELVDGFGHPDADLLDVVRHAKPAGAPGFGPASDAHRIRRLRRLDGLPVAIEEIWLDTEAAPRLQRDDLGPSLYRSYLDRFGLRIVRIEDRVGLAPLPVWGAGPLASDAGRAMGHVERIGWSQEGRPVEFSTTWFDADRARYVSRLK